VQICKMLVIRQSCCHFTYVGTGIGSIMRAKRSFILTASWAIAFIIALFIDAPVARFDQVSGLARFVEGKGWAQVIKAPGVIWFTFVVALLLLLVGQVNWKQMLFVMLAGVVSGTNGMVKWIVGRTRPYKLPDTQALQPFELHPFWHGLHGLFNQHDLCFPSGHECTAGALAVAVWLVWFRGRWIFLTIAVLVGIERVAENAHFASDVVGAAGFALLTTTLLFQAMRNWMQPVHKQGFEVITSF
jgi:membrane-associated phospholipid phosphatase